jgi:hypothetical protein
MDIYKLIGWNPSKDLFDNFIDALLNAMDEWNFLMKNGCMMDEW